MVWMILRASRGHHLCLWSTMHILALNLCWWSKFNVYSQKIVTKCDGIITKCDRLGYYKVRWTVITNGENFFITKCDTVYYKLRQVLQSAMIITNCDSTECFLKLFLLENVGCDRVFHCQKEKQCAVANCQILCMVI